MVLLATDGLSHDQIAARLDTRREVVSLWRKRFFEERLAGLDERSRPGRPGVFPQSWSFRLTSWLASCQLPHGVPISRWNTPDTALQV
jgi:transposase